MASLNDCLEALASTIRTYSKAARVFSWVPSPPKGDCVVMRPGPGTTGAFNRGTVRHEIEVMAIAGSLNEETAQRWLNDVTDLVGTESIQAVIFSHPTLGFEAAENVSGVDVPYTASALSRDGNRLISFDNNATFHWSCMVLVEILMKGSG